ncbi:MAG TPA: penicillin-binding protein 2 [Mycobacteriales bacterium]|nr:penicillin-binding protein 2 [Mycobacteriales bacterium]
MSSQRPRRPGPSQRSAGRSTRPSAPRSGARKATPRSRPSANAVRQPPPRRPAPKPQAKRAPAKKKKKKARRRRLLPLGNSGRRINVGFAVVATIALILGGRLIQLQGLEGTRYAAMASAERSDTQQLAAQRGQITDRDGNVMADSVEAEAIVANPRQIDLPIETAMALAPHLHMDVGDLQDKLTRDSGFVYLARQLDPKVADKIVKLTLPGIYSSPEFKRLHPAGEIGANIVGFTDIDGKGQFGIEQSQNNQLTGTPGEFHGMIGSSGTQIPSAVDVDKPAVAGNDIQLTLSQDLQYASQKYLDQAVHSTGAQGGEVTILDVKTGKVLAMASSPTFDARDPGKTPNLLNNPNVSNPFEPGSANKLITFAAAIENGLITPTTKFNVPGTIQVADRTIHDDWVHSPVDWTATGILAKSSNVGTLMIAQKLGVQKFLEYSKKFGQDAKTGIELPAESRGSLPQPGTAAWSGSTFGNIPIGQGMSVTSLQLASMYQTIANDGVRVPPRIIEKESGKDGTTTTATPKGIRVVSPKTARTVRDMMQMVTQDGGTAPKAAITGYTTGGKTGTGQKINPNCGCYEGGGYYSTFAGFAPADHPRYAISIMVDSPQTDYMGGDVAAPLFHEIMSYALKQGGVTPSGAKPARLPLLPE